MAGDFFVSVANGVVNSSFRCGNQMVSCVNHPFCDAQVACQRCNRPLCASCAVQFMGSVLCQLCRDGRLAELQGNQPYPLTPPSAADHLFPAKNQFALIGYYLGVFSLIPCAGNFLGPAAIVLGIFGLRARRANPNLPGQGHSIVAIALGTLTTLIYWGGPLAMYLWARR